MLQLDYYYGNIVEAIEKRPDGWAIVFEDGARIINEDENYPVPDNSLIGLKLSRAIIDPTVTRLYFGTDDNPNGTVMNLNPTKYALSNPNIEDGAVIRPQSTAEEVVEDFPAAAPGERVVEGPSEEWLEAQKAVDPDYTPNDE